MSQALENLQIMDEHLLPNVGQSASNRHWTLHAMDNDKEAGSIAFGTRGKKGIFSIYKLKAHPSYRNQGIGTALSLSSIFAIKRFCEKESHKAKQVHVNWYAKSRGGMRQSRLIQFYKSLGARGRFSLAYLPGIFCPMRVTIPLKPDHKC